jgi:hypothetical protein
MMAVMVKATPETKPSFEPGPPEPLFEAHLAPSPSSGFFQYDVTSDGKRFLLDTVDGDRVSVPTLNVVVTWDAGLKK